MKSIFVSIHFYLTFLLLCVFLFLKQRSRKYHRILQGKISCLSKVHNKYKWQVYDGGGHGDVRKAINYPRLLFSPRISCQVSVISKHKCLRFWATVFSFLSFIVIRILILSHTDLNLLHQPSAWIIHLSIWLSKPWSYLKMSGGCLEKLTVPNVFAPYEDRLVLYYPTF